MAEATPSPNSLLTQAETVTTSWLKMHETLIIIMKEEEKSPLLLFINKN